MYRAVPPTDILIADNPPQNVLAGDPKLAQTNFIIVWKFHDLILISCSWRRRNHSHLSSLLFLPEIPADL
jgi:hypothetical protein